MKLVYKAAVSGLALFSISALAQEYPLGHPVIKNGMEIQGVYLQPITMDTEEGHHAMSHLAADKADVHLEADIHAVEDNPNGFAEGDWIPYLTIEYSVTKLGDKPQTQTGTFMPMVASDGPHYGENIKLDGNGKYRVTYKIYPPSHNKDVAFGRHIDKETGVAPWFQPFEVSWDFDYAGVGRKGSY
ncbi:MULTISPECIES: iron transporter [Providencia]|uniref:Pathogen-specific membrane antigen n=1 Tax=Providencia rettgeri TaxID=587 RepID=A0A379FNP2_PRORE|nr:MULTISPECIES: iron transporter [Providencia]QXB07045.1 iron transporter [Providencia rettgeri]SUC30212.1 Pathogen-specific membrane antigen [Providencia rettgeri]HEM7132921.1 iron transporter [Providencia rettgeri]